MTIMENNRFGVSMMVFVFLLSLYSALVIKAHAVNYIGVNAGKQHLEKRLRTEIQTAIRQGQCFYVGVAKKNGTPIQSLCARQNSIEVPGTGQCKGGRHGDADIYADERCESTVTEVFYSKHLIDKSLVCDTERNLINEYWDHEKCLNRQGGKDNCITTDEGVVYLRIY